jgi:hypothetical protein
VDLGPPPITPSRLAAMGCPSARWLARAPPLSRPRRSGTPSHRSQPASHPPAGRPAGRARRSRSGRMVPGRTVSGERFPDECHECCGGLGNRRPRMTREKSPRESRGPIAESAADEWTAASARERSKRLSSSRQRPCPRRLAAVSGTCGRSGAFGPTPPDPRSTWAKQFFPPTPPRSPPRPLSQSGALSGAITSRFARTLRPRLGRRRAHLADPQARRESPWLGAAPSRGQ